MLQSQFVNCNSLKDTMFSKVSIDEEALFSQLLKQKQ